MGKVLFRVYGALMYLVLPLILLRYCFKGLRSARYFARFRERFGFIPDEIASGLIHVHAVSVGEANAAEPLVREILRMKGAQSVLMTCTTPTGSARIRQMFGDQVHHSYAPIDIGVSVRRFLSRAKPNLLVLIESEVWPNLICSCSERGIPIHFVNMRISDRSLRRSMNLRALHQFVTSNVAGFNVQTDADQARMLQLGASPEQVHVTGNLKFDMTVPEGLEAGGRQLREKWGAERPVILLGSSHPGEEELFVEMSKKLRDSLPNLVSIFVPRHPERFEDVFRLLEAAGLNTLRRSSWDSGESNGKIEAVLVDTMGELLNFYAACDVAVVGGSFVDVGGHNILEPIVAGAAVVFGPNMSNFRQIAELVAGQNAGHQVRSADELIFIVKELLDEPELRMKFVNNGRMLMEQNRGALLRTLSNLPELG